MNTTPTLEPPSTHAGFEVQLVAHQGPILRFLKTIVMDHHEAEDLLQRTNLILWQKRDGFEPGSNFRAWAFTIARWEALNQVRRRRRERLVLSEREHLERFPGPVPATDTSDEAPLLALRDCLKSLPSRDRELLSMRYESDRTLGEYAKSLDRSPGTLKARLFKIREVLRKSIEDRLRESDPRTLSS